MTQGVLAKNSSILTVATVDYLPQAVATLRSAYRQSPRSSFHLFAVDATADTIADLRRLLGNDATWICVFGPNDLGPERAGFLGVFNQYNAVELCCLAKYVGISHVLRDPSAGNVCIFADADTLFLGDVHEPIEAMGERAVLLTPHYMGPSNDILEHDTMMHGWINAGFLAFRRSHPGTWRILDWLINRVSRRGFFAPQYGLSCDQTWLSAMPVLFHDLTYVSRHRGLNVGYWNLSERPLARSGKAILAGDSPLLLFHFSGFDWTHSKRLSKHSECPVPPGSILEELCQLYLSELNDVADLEVEIKGLETFACSKADLIERIHVGSLRNGVNIVTPTTELGFFSRVGGKIDSLFRKTIAWRGR
ncbi:hypothetical protein [Candidatus Methylomirabilis sp.]|uniref:hypothetical protein n=1 Tax=Candidatus Methylomirabilis sp. TaxID=2032687 RepID=UPI002A61E7E2|nr:hypothetical protein [Candidatus Methylomirabilis sp.]